MNQVRLMKEREGVVTSNRMQKTVVVAISRNVIHPRYKKYVKRVTSVKAHDPKDECQIGDRVLIVECRPLSRDKRWRVRKVMERSVAAGDTQDDSETAPAVQPFATR